MVFISVNKQNIDEYESEINSAIDTPGNVVFILYYMHGCGPCNATRPEWNKLKQVMKHLAANKHVYIIDIDKDLADRLKYDKSTPVSFPTMRVITNGGNTVFNYEDSDIQVKDRTIDSFVNWINSVNGTINVGGTVKRRKRTGKRTLRKKSHRKSYRKSHGKSHKKSHKKSYRNRKY